MTGAHRDSDLPDGVINADPPGGWDGTGDREAQERSAAAAQSAGAENLVTDAALAPDDPVTGEAVRRGADPDLSDDEDRGEEP